MSLTPSIKCIAHISNKKQFSYRPVANHAPDNRYVVKTLVHRYVTQLRCIYLEIHLWWNILQFLSIWECRNNVGLHVCMLYSYIYLKKRLDKGYMEDPVHSCISNCVTGTNLQICSESFMTKIPMIFDPRRRFSGCSPILLLCGIWWPCSIKNIKRYVM